MIKIQLLDYKYDNFSNNLVNFNNVTSQSTWVIDNLGKASITTGGSSTRYLTPATGNLTKGLQYEASVTISGYSGTGGDIGFSSAGSETGTSMGNGNNLKRTSDGTSTYAFTAGASEGLKILAQSTAGGTVTASVTQRGGINWNESVVGDLDVGDSDDFPLAMSFSVADARNLNTRTGTYSKTFKIPATKNNNKILKSSYNEGYYLETNTISNQKQCRIEVDNNLSIVGILQVTAIGKSTEPLYYSCVFYGNNVDWASSLNNKLLKDLSVNSVEDGSGWDNLNGRTGDTGVSLQANRDSIMATWEVDNAVYQTPFGGTQVASTNPIVYPIVGYGENNEGGADGRLQLLKTKYDAVGGLSTQIGYDGWDSESPSEAYPTPTPSMDWRPAIFIYDIVKQLFTQEGYSIVSNFINSDLFKGITMLLPNFRYNNVSQRITENSIYCSFQSGTGETGYVGDYSVLTASTSATQDVWEELSVRWDAQGNFITQEQSLTYSDVYGEFSIAEYGFYNINMTGIGGWLQSVCEGDSTRNEVDYIRIKCEVLTAGETKWKNIGNAYGLPEDNNRYYYSCSAFSPFGFDFESLNIENQWLNKNDKVRFRTQYRMGHADSGPKTIGWDVYLYGGTGVTAAPTAGQSGCNGAISIEFQGENVEYGQTFDLKNVIDSESTQLGFLRGIIHAFNLQFTTDTVSKIIYIEPFNDFFKNQNEAVDWTYKVDTSKSQEDKWVQSELKRELIFKYKTDSNDKVVEHRGNTYWSGILDEYPYREFLSSEFEVGQSIFENPFFAGSYNSRDGQTYAGSASTLQTPIRANLWGLCDTGAVPTQGSGCRPPKGYNFTPRLVNYIKNHYLANPTTPVRFAAGVQVWGSNDLMAMIPGYVSTYVTPILAYANSIDAFTFSGNPRQPLSYASVNQGTYNFTNNSIGSPTAFKGLYQTYYQSMIEQIKANPRIKTVYVNLKLTDIMNLDLRKLIYIEGYYYRINRIIDYKPNNNEITKVELVLWEDKGYSPIDTSFNS